MAVLKGEGRVPILFGSWALPIPPNRSAYIARPDLGGEHPTIVLAHDAGGVTSGIKAVARHLARHGYSVLVPELERGGDTDDGFEWSVSDLEDAVDSARVPGTEWASGDDLTLMGVGAGSLLAAVTAPITEPEMLVLVGGPLESQLLEQYDGSLLVIRGDDDAPPGDEVRALQSTLDRGEWVLYGGVGAGFLDDGHDDFVEAAASDALERLIARLDRRFGTVAPA